MNKILDKNLNQFAVALVFRKAVFRGFTEKQFLIVKKENEITQIAEWGLPKVACTPLDDFGIKASKKCIEETGVMNIPNHSRPYLQACINGNLFNYFLCMPYNLNPKLNAIEIKWMPIFKIRDLNNLSCELDFFCSFPSPELESF